MSLSSLFHKLRPVLEQHIVALPEPWPRYTLFLSFSDGRRRTSVIHLSGEGFEALWVAITAACRRLATRRGLEVCWLRADWVTAVQPLTWKTLRDNLTACKRNYFRYGLALDKHFNEAFLEGELNGNAMLYGGNQVNHAVINEKNFRLYASQRFGGLQVDFVDDKPVYVLRTQGIFCADETAPALLYPSGRNAGRRIIEPCDTDTVRGMIDQGGRYLSRQVQDSGRFHYGWHACFDRPINAYNALRHASTTYAMLEAWEITRDANLLVAIERSLAYLTQQLIRFVILPDGEEVAFLVDQGGEIKLGGNAVCLLALSQYCELFDTDKYLPLLEALALGIRFMQDSDSGEFVHVLRYPDLAIKDAFRIIYYDGEAAFGLMRLYRLTRDPRWLAMVEKAFDSFIAREHWRAHDHWLGYCVNELTIHRPEERYYRFGIQNIAGHLDFVLSRITTFPTLLELMMAASQMIERLRRQPAYSHLLEAIDLAKFDKALTFRAGYLMNGHFWPEYAMYFRNPRRILGSFFIRHQAFRVRIDDVEHYLSGYVAYFKHLMRKTSMLSSVPKPKRRAVAAPIRTVASSPLLCARLADFSVDVERLRAHFRQQVVTTPATPYRDNRVDYLGWAVTSRDGTLADGVRRIAPNGAKTRRGDVPTPICTGYLAEVMDRLKALGIAPYRARMMLLESEGKEMPFHSDASREAWRLHIPLVTNPQALFQWQNPSGGIDSIHLPADGSAWLVRVDVLHRAINTGPGAGGRVHLLMGLGVVPDRDMLAGPHVQAAAG